MTEPPRRWAFDATNDGEIIVITLDGKPLARLKIEDAERLKRQLMALPESIHDAITMAKGINPRSGEPF